MAGRVAGFTSSPRTVHGGCGQDREYGPHGPRDHAGDRRSGCGNAGSRPGRRHQHPWIGRSHRQCRHRCRHLLASRRHGTRRRVLRARRLFPVCAGDVGRGAVFRRGRQPSADLGWPLRLRGHRVRSAGRFHHGRAVVARRRACQRRHHGRTGRYRSSCHSRIAALVSGRSSSSRCSGALRHSISPVRAWHRG